MFFSLLTIFYFEEKYNFAEIISGSELEKIETLTEFVKVKDLQEIKKNIYYTTGYQYALEFLVYFNKKFYMHTRKAPIVFKKPLDMDPGKLYMILSALFLNRGQGLKEVFAANNRTEARLMNKILIFTIDFELNLSEENDDVKIVKIDDESQIYEKIFAFDFVKKYNEHYLIVSPKLKKIKDIGGYQEEFDYVENKKLYRLIDMLKKNEDYKELLF